MARVVFRWKGGGLGEVEGRGGGSGERCGKLGALNLLEVKWRGELSEAEGK